MGDLADGASVEVQGSGAKPYVLKNTGGVYSCSCPAWRNQSNPPELRSCKHLRTLRGDAVEDERVGAQAAPVPRRPSKSGEDDAGEGPPLLLAETWAEGQDPTGWWMSEKLDGVRAYWDGQQFLSRQGNTYRAPDWFISGLPGLTLDGELWIGRKMFQRTVSIVRRQDKSDEWKELCFAVFDAPDEEGTFEERTTVLRKWVAKERPTYARQHPHEKCRGLAHLKQELARVEALGGEGLMLRKPGSLYEPRRSSTLLKVKTFQDAEARVVGHAAGAGRHQGRLGALELEMKNGARFSVASAQPTAAAPAAPVLSEPQVTAPAANPVPAGDTPGRRHFELVDATSSKFWEIEVQGEQHTVCFGRIGTKGQAKTKAFANADAAAGDAAKLIKEKVSKGYKEQ